MESWKELVDWTDTTTNSHVIKILRDWGHSDAAIQKQLNITEEQFKEMLEDKNKKQH